MAEQIKDRMHAHRLFVDGKEQPGEWKVGMTINTERLGVCRVFKVHHMGTIDVQAKDGRCYRISGLPVQVLP